MSLTFASSVKSCLLPAHALILNSQSVCSFIFVFVIDSKSVLCFCVYARYLDVDFTIEFSVTSCCYAQLIIYVVSFILCLSMRSALYFSVILFEQTRFHRCIAITSAGRAFE